MLQLSVVIATYNEPEFLRLTLQSYLAQTFKDFEIIIADDGSAKETKDVINHYKEMAWCPITHIWQEDKGFRKAAILNKAVIVSKGQYVLFTDHDCLVSPTLIEQIMMEMDSMTLLQIERQTIKKRITHKMVKGRLSFNIEELEKYSRANTIIQFLRRLKTTCGLMSGFGFCAPRKEIVRVNGFNEEFQTKGCGEDGEMGYRLWKNGCKPLYRKSINVYHLWHRVEPRWARIWPKGNTQGLKQLIRNNVRIVCSKGLSFSQK